MRNFVFATAAVRFAPYVHPYGSFALTSSPWIV